MTTNCKTEHDLQDVDMSHYTNEMWATEIYEYLTATGATHTRATKELERLGLKL